MMANSLETIAADLETFAADMVAKAATLAAKQAAVLQGLNEEWQALYATAPAGRLRDLPEINSISLSLQSSADRASQTGAEADRYQNFGQTAGSILPPMHPAP